jgi:phosphate transport system permease protein
MDTKYNIKTRYAKERLFEIKLKGSILFIIAVLLLMFSSIIYNAKDAFIGYYIELDTPSNFSSNPYNIQQVLNFNFPNQEQRNIIASIIGEGRYERAVKEILQSQVIDSKLKVKLKYEFLDIKNSKSEVDNFFQLLEKNGKITKEFDVEILTNNNSSFAENAGLLGSISGSLLTVLVALSISIPIGVITGIFMQEMLNDGIIKSFIETNINNLASIPSIIYGLLGLSIFISLFHIPRSSSLLAGLTISIMTLPLIIISTRQALSNIPQSLRHGIIALGISRSQMIIHHLLPLIIPGIMSGTIFTISRVLGETAPLLLLGMVCFIANTAYSILEPTTTLTVQIYLWSVSIDKAYIAKTFAAILVLLSLISILNLSAFIIRKKYEYRW